jgi:hypothetical protein
MSMPSSEPRPQRADVAKPVDEAVAVSGRRRAVLVAGGALAAVGLAAGATFALGGGDDEGDLALPPVPSVAATPAPSATATAPTPLPTLAGGAGRNPFVARVVLGGTIPGAAAASAGAQSDPGSGTTDTGAAPGTGATTDAGSTGGTAGTSPAPAVTGPRGATGEKGATGERGATGASGPTGATGAQGPAGAPGPSLPVVVFTGLDGDGKGLFRVWNGGDVLPAGPVEAGDLLGTEAPLSHIKVVELHADRAVLQYGDEPLTVDVGKAYPLF